MAKCGVTVCGCSALMLVLLRLSIGWHFFAEGSQKVVVDEAATGRYRVKFSAEDFLQQAKGPVAPLLYSQLPGQHKWRSLLAQPLRNPTSPTDQSSDETTGDQSPVDVPSNPAFAAWARQILNDWAATRDRFLKTSALSDEQRRQARELYVRRGQQLVDYLKQEAPDIVDYRHQLWRLKNWQEDPAAGELPYLDSRIAAKQREVSQQPILWLNEVRTMETNFTDDLRNLLSDAERANEDTAAALEAALADPKQRMLDRLNVGVTCLVLGVGVCLLLGFFTRLASLAGALFLFSVMITQPPWIPGAVDDYFWYQLVELTALLVLMATGAGRWAGLDYFSYSLWGKLRGSR